MEAKQSNKENNKLSLRERWKMSPKCLRWINFRGSIYWYALWLVVVLVVLLIASMLLTRNNLDLQNVFVAIFTGAISSTIVTILLQIKQDKLQNEKKRSILFDAGFFIKIFTDRYPKIVKNSNHTWVEKYLTVEESIKFLADIYINQPQLFDTTEIHYLRDIRNNYRFITRLIEVPLKDHKMDQQTDKEIKELLYKISVNIGCLKIYWEELDLIPKD